MSSRLTLNSLFSEWCAGRIKIFRVILARHADYLAEQAKIHVVKVGQAWEYLKSIGLT